MSINVTHKGNALTSMEVLGEYRTVKFQQDRYKIVLGNLKTLFQLQQKSKHV